MVVKNARSLLSTAVLALAVSLGAVQAHADQLVIDVTGIQSFAGLGSDANTYLEYQLGAGAHITGLDYSVSLTAYSPTALAGISAAFSNATYYELFLSPAPVTDNYSGTASYSGSFNLVDQGLDFSLEGDGVLGVEFFDAYNDAISPSGIWNSGTLTVTYDTVAAVPEPETYALMLAGLGAIAWAAKRRRAR